MREILSSSFPYRLSEGLACFTGPHPVTASSAKSHSAHSVILSCNGQVVET